MEFISFLLIAFIVPLVIGWFSSHEQREKPGGEGKVHQTLPILIIGIVGTAFFWLFAAAAYFLGGEAGPALGFIAISSLGLFLIVSYINCRTEFDDDGFTVKGFWGIKRRYTYADVTHIKETSRGTYIYMGKRWVSFGIFDAGWDEFIQTVKRKYKKIYGRAIPVRPPSKFDPFKGNVDNFESYAFIFAMIEMLLIVALVIVCVNDLNPNYAKNTELTETEISDFSVSESGHMIFFGSDGSKYVIYQIISGAVDENRILSLCDGKTKVKIYAEEKSTDELGNYRRVGAMSADDEDILTFDGANKEYRERNTSATPVVLGIVIVFNLLIAFSIYIGRNPKKHPKLFAGIFGQHAKGE